MPKLVIQDSGVSKSERRTLNFIEGTNVTITISDDVVGNQADIQIDATSGGVTDHGALTGLSDDDHTQYIRHAIADAQGDLLLASAADTFVRLGIGGSGTVLTSDGTTASWQAPGAASHPGFASHNKFGAD